MKAIKYLVTMFVLAFIVASCNVLDKEPLDAFTDDNFWTNVSNVEAYATPFYNQFYGYGNGASTNGWFYWKTLNDDQVSSGFTNWDQEGKTTTNADWANGYAYIRRANVMIERVLAMSDAQIGETDRMHWIGVAKLMRAYNFFLLVRTFGDVQWVNTIVQAEDKDILYGKRTDRDIVMDSILTDLDFAVANIKTDKATFAWSKGLAYAIKSDICLFEGTFCKYRNESDGQKAPDNARATKYLQECVKANDAIIALGYKLQDGIGGYQATYNSLDLTGSTQVILAKHYVKDVFMHSLIDYTMGTTQEHGISKVAFDAFRTTTGAKATNDQATWKPLKTADGTDDSTATLISYSKGDETITLEDIKKQDAYKDKTDDEIETAFTAQGYTKKVEITRYYGHLVLDDILQERDLRLRVLVDSVLCYVGNGYIRYDGYANNQSEMYPSSGFGVLKYDTKEITELTYRNTANKNYTDAPLFWLAVVLLNQAEAKCELGTCTDDDLNTTVNLLRKRANLPALSTANYYEEASLLDAIRNERRCELVMDNWYRYWDLVRWHQLDLLTKEECYLGAHIANDPNIINKLNSIEVNAQGYIVAPYYKEGKKREWNPKYYIYPIPDDQRTLNPQLGQNKGWE